MDTICQLSVCFLLLFLFFSPGYGTSNREVGDSLIRLYSNNDSPLHIDLFEELNSLGAIIDRVSNGTIDFYANSDIIVPFLERNKYPFEKFPTQSENSFLTLIDKSTNDECCSDAYWNQYHDYESLTDLLHQFQRDYSTICSLESIGQSVMGRELWMMKISDNVGVIEEGEPQFQYIGNMHGNEVIGRELLLRYIYYLLSEYQNGNDAVKELVDTTQIYIVPTMNPDGYELNQRANANNIDLNRDFPDRLEGMDHFPQPETAALMACSLSNHFVLSANLHGGSLVVNYPYDGNTQHRSGVYTSSPDDLLFIDISEAYSRHNRPMYESEEFENGITNGADWYTLYGGMQDWNYEKTYSNFHVTIELGYTKWPDASTLGQYWEDNRVSLSSYLRKIHQGVRGFITNSDGEKMEGLIYIDDIEHPVITSKLDGWYYRPLAPGSYRIWCSCPQYSDEILEDEITVTEYAFTVKHFHFS